MPARLRLFFCVLNVALFFIPAMQIFRNWERIRTEHLWSLLGYAAVCGALLMLVIVIATGRLAYRGETAPRA